MRNNHRPPDAESEPLVRRVETDEDDRIVVDFGADANDASADVVDGTVIVVGPEDEQFEFEVPSSEARTFIRNGVLTIEVSE